MKKLELFILAMAAEEYRRSAWVISAFSMIAEDRDAWKKEPYPYRISQQPDGHYFVDPTQNNQLTLIEDAPASLPPFHIKEAIVLNAGDLPNVTSTVTTNYGTALVNAIVLCYPFKNKIPYIAEKFNPAMLEKIITKRFQDTPEDPALRDDKHIYVDEYLKFTDAMFSLEAYTQLCVPAYTEKSLSQCPGIYALRDQLIEKYKDRLHDPATIAVIDAALIAFYKEWLKGDESEGFLIEKKSIDIVRKRLLMMHGAETGLEDNVDVVLIKNSLSEGWDISAFPAMNNSLRAGSFNRGQQTELGGVAVKELLRAASNLRVTDNDCGSTMGVDIVTGPSDQDKLIGFTAIEKVSTKTAQFVGDSQISFSNTKITEDNVGTYLGKKVTLRSPMFCQLEKTDYCRTCVGDKLASSPTGLPTVVSAYGSAFLATFMSAAHSKALSLAKMNYLTAIT